MADLPSPRSPDPRASQSTRQLLDDLDSLMQRMLALPVQNGEEEIETDDEPLPAPTPAPIVQATPPRSVNLMPTPPADDAVDIPPKTEQPLPTRKGKKNAARKEQPLRVAETAQPEAATSVAAPAPSPDPFVPILLRKPKKMAERKGPPLLPPSMPPTDSPRPEPLPAPRPIWLKPSSAPAPTAEPTHGSVMQWLLNINGIYDGVTRILGPLGRWLRGEQGRSLLGWTGVAMIVVATIWALLAFLS